MTSALNRVKRNFYSQFDINQEDEAKSKFHEQYRSSVHFPTSDNYQDEAMADRNAFSSSLDDGDYSNYPRYISYSNPNYMYYDDVTRALIAEESFYQTPRDALTNSYSDYTTPYIYNTSTAQPDYFSDTFDTNGRRRPYHLHHHQHQRLLKEEEEFKAEERRRKLMSDVVRDGTQNGLAGVSAGELLNKTHEELVLLLIQLRRQHSALQEARKQARRERDSQVGAILLI